MKSIYQVALASLVSVLMVLTPASAYASKSANGTRSHSHTFHDRTPRVHTLGLHIHQR